MYADTDFFLALLKKQDWLKGKAEIVYKRYKRNIWTSPVTLIELLLLAERHSLDPEELLVDVLHMVAVKDCDTNAFLVAAHYIKEYNLRVFDALHASFCGKDRIISSGRIYDRVGLERGRLGIQ
ncbi:MAG: PIN domain-containing protein [Candidatus Aenigmarchaeota archaeon]|nr:PIN domain-containing protein [Candidatus Aenigmarchaeota archaeon]